MIMYLCVDALYICTCVHVLCGHSCMSLYMYICMFVHMHASICMYVWMDIGRTA